jgi:hypothetical protein
MRRLLAFLVLSSLSAQAQTITETFGSGTNQFSIDFVHIGNPGNAGNTTLSYSNVGRVDYAYNIGKFEISREVLAKANSAGGLGIPLVDMSGFGGNTPFIPATGNYWTEAARFVNWLNLSSGNSAAYKFTGSSFSLWNSGDIGFNPQNPYRNTQAKYFLPSLDEWYKAAYYDPNKSSTGGFWKFATGSDNAPTAVSGGDLQGTAVYNQPYFSNPADVTNAGGLSAYGTMAQSGNAWEWIETAYDGVNDSALEDRFRLGGSWGSDGIGSELLSSDSYNYYPSEVPDVSRNVAIGFRVASVPEPSSLSLLLAGGVVALARRRKS